MSKQPQFFSVLLRCLNKECIVHWTQVIKHSKKSVKIKNDNAKKIIIWQQISYFTYKLSKSVWLAQHNPTKVGWKLNTTDNGEQYATIIGEYLKHMSYVACWTSLGQNLRLEKQHSVLEEVLTPSGWTPWNAEVMSLPLQLVGMMDGDNTTADIARTPVSSVGGIQHLVVKVKRLPDDLENLSTEIPIK